MTTENVPPLRIREEDGAPNAIPVYEIIVSNGTLTQRGPGRVGLATGAGGGGGFTVPLIVSSGGTGQTSHTEVGILMGRGTNAIESIGAMNYGELIVGSNNTVPPQLLGAGSQGQMLISNSSLRLGVQWANTQAAGAGGTKTIRIPMSVLTVNPNNANVYYTTTAGSKMDASYFTFSDGVVGKITYWANTPSNLNSSENWNIWFSHEPKSGAGGNAILTFRGHFIVDNTAHDTTPVTLISSGTYATYGAGTMAISSAASGILDNTLGLAANGIFRLVVERSGGNASDTVNADWNLWGTFLQCDVDT